MSADLCCKREAVSLQWCRQVRILGNRQKTLADYLEERMRPPLKSVSVGMFALTSDY